MKYCLIALAIYGIGLSSGTGSITGLVTEVSGNPLVGASVLVDGTASGCMTDGNGVYYIPRLSPGEYSITARMVGMAAVTVEGVAVVSDQNTIVDIEMREEAAGSTVITVTGQRNLVLETVPSSIHVMDREQIETMAVTGVVDVIQSQAGVSTRDGEIHVRGGRSGEVDFLLDGVSMRSPVTNSFSASIPLSAVAEVSTITGGFGAEYGNALSGVVKMAVREGGEGYSGSLETYYGDNSAFGTESGDRGDMSISDDDNYLSDCVKGQVALGGPEPVSSYLLPSLGVNIPGEYRVFTALDFSRSGYDMKDSRGNWDNNWRNGVSGIVNLTGRINPLTGIKLLGRYSHGQAGWDDWAWSRFDEPVYVDGSYYLGSSQDLALPIRFSETWSVKAELNRMVGRSTVVEGSFEYSVFSDWNRIRNGSGGYVGEDLTPSAWYAEYFQDRVTDSLGFFHSGIHSSVWLDSRSSVTGGSIGMTSQVSRTVKLKAGLECSLYDIYDFSVTEYSPSQIWVNIWEASPRAGAAFLQATSNFSGAMVLTTGIRVDAFDPNEEMTIPGESGTTEIPLKIQVSPRFGVNHPISERDVFFATYGRYFQMPSMNKMFSGTSYNLGSDQSIVGNPDLDAIRTIAYEAGVRHRTGDLSTLSVTAFYKEVTGLVQSVPSETSSGSSVFMYDNDDSHATVQGAEVTLMKLPGEMFSWDVSYTYSIAEGRYSSANEQFQYSSQGYGILPVDDNYLDWDQRHLVNCNLNMWLDQDSGIEIHGFHPFEFTRIGAGFHYGSGYPYSLFPESELPEINTRRQPYTMNTDVRYSRTFYTGGFQFTLKATVFNLFDRRNIDTVYDTGFYEITGDPGGISGNPSAWSPARHFFFAVEAGW